MESVINLSDYFKFLLALGIVIGLIVLLGVLLRRFGAGFPSAMSKARRLGIVEALALDAKHRLVLIKRDDKEHLVILGHTSDSVIETNIAPLESEIDPELDISDINVTDMSGKNRHFNSINQRFKDLLPSMKSNQK